MLRRLKFFGIGSLLSVIIIASVSEENRLKTTFIAYKNYFDMDKRVITHLENDSTNFTTIAECQMVYYNLVKEDVLLVLNDGNVNFDLSDKDGDPCQYYVVENVINGMNLSVTFEYCYTPNTVRVMRFVANKDDEVCNL